MRNLPRFGPGGVLGEGSTFIMKAVQTTESPHPQTILRIAKNAYYYIVVEGLGVLGIPPISSKLLGSQIESIEPLVGSYPKDFSRAVIVGSLNYVPRKTRIHEGLVLKK